jgi:hypothetical protein
MIIEMPFQETWELATHVTLRVQHQKKLIASHLLSTRPMGHWLSHTMESLLTVDPCGRWYVLDSFYSILFALMLMRMLFIVFV